MADLKISELPVATAPTGTELVEIVQGGVNKQTTVSTVGGAASDASETVKGIIEIATQAETNTGTDDVRALTPLKLTNATPVTNKQLLVNAAGALTDGATVTISLIKHTLTSVEGGITFTISYTGDQTWTKIILNAASATWTFPSGALCVVEGVATGNNIAPVTGISGDTFLVNTVLFGSIHIVFVKNCGQ